MAVGVVISATLIGVFVEEAVTVMDGRVGRSREADGEVARGQFLVQRGLEWTSHGCQGNQSL